MQGSVSISVTMAGTTARVTKTRTDDGVIAISPTATPATAGTLTTRTNNTDGVITTADTDVETGLLAILTWEDADGVLKHRYNVDCVVTLFGDSGDGDDDYTVAISGGAGDNLPAEDETVNISLQVEAGFRVDFDDMGTFLVSTNVRGVVVFMDTTDTEMLVVDMDSNGACLWLDDGCIDAPMAGASIEYVLIGSGATGTTSFLPKIMGLYDATPGSGD